MMMKSMKRLVLTGAAVMVMMSFAAPAMAADLTDLIDPSAGYTDYESTFAPSVNSDEWQQPVEVGPAPNHVTPPCDPQIETCIPPFRGFWGW
jgi:hypothetical protein